MDKLKNKLKDILNDKYFVLFFVLLALAIVCGAVVIMGAMHGGMVNFYLTGIVAGMIISATIILYFGEIRNIVTLSSEISDSDGGIEEEKTTSLKSGELNPLFAGKILAESLKENNGYVLIDKYLCIGKEKKDEDKVFDPSECLVNILNSKEITIKRKGEDMFTNFDETTGIVEHKTQHYCITNKGVLFHIHDKNKRSDWFWTSSYLKKREFEKKFKEEFENGEKITKEKIIEELNNNVTKNNEKSDFLVLTEDKKYRYAKIKEMKNFIETIS
ncbi:MAG: hypothetical protein CVT88_07520 [Candidatus Altiarchaeales archaeon HGW-Altiarchaeales-1]|nr:MAG: hypothetical protein CVT88_07520 [Candidatus Altiarchaeales archaeon HGW-Altiarchaeales-1]